MIERLKAFKAKDALPNIREHRIKSKPTEILVEKPIEFVIRPEVIWIQTIFGLLSCNFV